MFMWSVGALTFSVPWDGHITLFLAAEAVSRRALSRAVGVIHRPKYDYPRISKYI